MKLGVYITISRCVALTEKMPQSIQQYLPDTTVSRYLDIERVPSVAGHFAVAVVRIPWALRIPDIARRGFPDGGIDAGATRVRVNNTRARKRRCAADVSSSSLLRQQGCGERGGSFRRASNDIDALVSGNRYPDSGESGPHIVSHPFSRRTALCRFGKLVREASACVGRIRFILFLDGGKVRRIYRLRGRPDTLTFLLDEGSFDRSPNETCRFQNFGVAIFLCELE